MKKKNPETFDVPGFVAYTEPMSKYFIHDIESFADLEIGGSTPKIDFQNSIHHN